MALNEHGPDGWRSELPEYTSASVAKCESPIEVKMLKALAYAPWPSSGLQLREWGGDTFVPVGSLVNNILADVLTSVEAKIIALRPRVIITPQAPILNFRADILVEADLGIFNGGKVKMVVECDGHEYHTDRQSSIRDMKRDSAMRAAGYHVMRFSGSEIFRNSADCAKRVVECVVSCHLASGSPHEI